MGLEAEKMSDIEIKTQTQVDDLKTTFKKIPENMRFFSLSMRSLYTDKAVGGSDEASRKFRKLRDDTRKDADVYLKCILPATTKYVSSLKEYFEYYIALSYEEWCEMLPDILEDTKTNRHVAQVVLLMHEGLMVPLKMRQDEAKILMKEFHDLEEKFEKEKKKLMAKAEDSKWWASALSFVPIVNAIASPLLESAARGDMAKAIAKGAEKEIQGAAALVVAETLIPALSKFIDGLRKTAGFFQNMEKELESFEGQAEKGIKSPKRLYYKVMSTEAVYMKSLCLAFYAVLPDVRTDFQAIPNEGTDQNYVDKWLAKEEAEIKKHRSKKVQEMFRDIWKLTMGSAE